MQLLVLAKPMPLLSIDVGSIDTCDFGTIYILYYQTQGCKVLVFVGILTSNWYITGSVGFAM